MSGVRHPPAAERVIADLPLNRREALVIEVLDSGKVRCWRCSRTLAGRTVLASASRSFSIPISHLGQVWPVFQRIDAETRREHIRRAS